VGRFAAGAEVDVEVLPFRACLLMATTKPVNELGVSGCDYAVVRDVAGKPAVLKLLGRPGETAAIQLLGSASEYAGATLDGKPLKGLLEGETIRVSFPGQPPKEPWHRKLGDLKPSTVPADAESLYEATCFAADNNALEVRSLLRSGPTRIPQVWLLRFRRS
jgi:hypothetical protein